MPPGRARNKAKHKEERDAWLAKLKERDVEPWPEAETDKEHEEKFAESRSMVDEVIRLFPGAELHETEHFLFVSNIPPQQIGPYILSLDRMYDWMCRLYGVPHEQKVWLGGKAPIFAFLDHDQFEAFEDRYFPEAKETLHTLSNIYGLSHLRGERRGRDLLLPRRRMRTTSDRCSSTKRATGSSIATRPRRGCRIGSMRAWRS